MKKLLVVSSITALTILGYSCSPKAAKTTTTNTNVTVSAEVLAQGKEISETNCGKCHRLHEANEFTAEKWSRVLDRMIPKAKLSEEQGNILRQYYAVNAKQG